MDLFAAALFGDIDGVRDCLDGGADPNMEDMNGHTPLLYAARGGHTGALVLLLKSGADPNIKDANGQIPILSAIQAGHTDAVYLLLKHGADPNVKDANGQSPIVCAIQEGHTDAVYFLLKYGADPDVTGTDGLPLLLSTAQEGDSEVVHLLLKNEADPNIKDTSGQTPILRAAQEGHAEVVYLLLKSEADPNIKDTKSRTPLLYAAKEGHIKSMYLLLKNEADPNTKDANGRTPILCAAQEGHTEAVSLLLKNGADPDIAGESGYTARYVALQHKNWNIVKLLENPSVQVEKEAMKHPRRISSTQKAPKENNSKRLAVCQHFSGHVRYFSKRGMWLSSTVYDIVYSRKLDEFSRMQTLERESDSIVKETIRWFHLPAINRVWIKDLIKKLGALDRKPREQCKAVEQFIDDTFMLHKSSIPRSRFASISFQNGSSERNSFVMPYIDMDSIMHLETNRSGMQCRGPVQTNFQQMEALQNVYDVSDLHLAQTLDRSYYEALEDKVLNRRDNSQVISRTESRNQSQAEMRSQVRSWRQLRERPKVLMVKQLWLWKIDEGTVITAFPQRWDITNDNNTLLRKILGDGSWHNRVQSADDLIALIFQRCTEFVYEPFNAGLEESLFYKFSSYISKISDAVAKSSESLLMKGDQPKPEALEPEEIRIEDEMDNLKDIQDVLDELNMISVVFAEQKKVIKNLNSWLYETQKADDGQSGEEGDSADTSESKDLVDEQKGDATNSGKGQQYWNVLINNYSTNSTCQHIERMQADAVRVEKMLNHLLDMKQKQANLGEARSARKQAADTARQGNFILAFTVVTVIFTPLSFAAAYLAIPDNSGASRTARILGIAESATLAVVIPVLVYLTWSDHIGAKNMNKVKI